MRRSATPPCSPLGTASRPARAPMRTGATVSHLPAAAEHPGPEPHGLRRRSCPERPSGRVERRLPPGVTPDMLGSSAPAPSPFSAMSQSMAQAPATPSPATLAAALRGSANGSGPGATPLPATTAAVQPVRRHAVEHEPGAVRGAGSDHGECAATRSAALALRRWPFSRCSPKRWCRSRRCWRPCSSVARRPRPWALPRPTRPSCKPAVRPRPRRPRCPRARWRWAILRPAALALPRSILRAPRWRFAPRHWPVDGLAAWLRQRDAHRRRPAVDDRRQRVHRHRRRAARDVVQHARRSTGRVHRHGAAGQLALAGSDGDGRIRPLRRRPSPDSPRLP